MEEICRAKVAVEFKVVEVVHLDAAARPANSAVCTVRKSIVCYSVSAKVCRKD